MIEVSVGQLVGMKCQSISSYLFKRLLYNSAQTFFLSVQNYMAISVVV